jgi:hypothetical protein
VASTVPPCALISSLTTAGAADRAARAATPKSVEDARQFLRPETRPGIRHLDAHAAVLGDGGGDGHRVARNAVT